MILNHMINKETGHELKCEDGQVEACKNRGYVIKGDVPKAKEEAKTVQAILLDSLDIFSSKKGAGILKRLKKAKYLTPQDVLAASEKDLIDLYGINAENLPELLKACKGALANDK